MLTQNKTTPALIHHARIIDVNVATWTVNVATEFTQKLYTDVSFNIPYTHPNNGEGMYFMPEVGSICWLCEPSDGSMPFILAWTSSQDETDFSSRKQGLNPGDIYLGTRDENFLWLRRGGVVQIGSTGLCQRIYMPLDNSINDFCENYNLHSLGGDLTWTIQRSENDTDGNRPALFTLAGREFADDPNPIATLEIGSHGSNDNTILSLSILASGQNGAAQQVSLQIDDEGNVSWVIQQDLSYTVSGSVNFNVTGDYTVTSQGNVQLSSPSSSLDLESTGQATLAGQTEVTLDAPVTAVTQLLTVAGGGVPFVLAPVIAWLAAHTHNLTAPTAGSPTTPPIEAPALAAPGFVSTKASSSG